MSLYEELTAYCKTDAYPFHMPGHKRRLGQMADPFSFDVTEIDGFDDLHHAEGLLKQAQERAARLYGSSKTFYLINGSTAGILAAVSACGRTEAEEKPLILLMARNCHRSVWHAAYLNRLQTVCLPVGLRGDLNGPVDPEQVERALDLARSSQNGRVCAVLITSPTYDGVVSDVAAIARTAHRHRVPLIVDEAHGAHFGMHPLFPPSSVQQGADLVIHSLHKTLPSLTQTALLHVNGTLVDERRVAQMLDIYQTSSPSYVLMSSIDNCVRLLEERGEELFQTFAENLRTFWSRVGLAGENDNAKNAGHDNTKGAGRRFRNLTFLRAQDPSRILIRPEGITALQLYELLRVHYQIQPELCAPTYVLLLCSVGDDAKGFERLYAALREIDQRIEAQKGNPLIDGKIASPALRQEPLPHTERVMRLDEALDGPSESIPLWEATGRVSAEFLYLYPPGIPLIAPGERFKEELIGQLEKLQRAGFVVRGGVDETLQTVRVAKKTERQSGDKPE